MRKRIGAVTAIMVLTAFSAHAAYAATTVESFSLLSAFESFASDVVTGVEHIAEAIGQNIAALSGNASNNLSYSASAAASVAPAQDATTTGVQPSEPATTTVTEIIQREQPIIDTTGPSDTITNGELSSLLAGLTNVLSLLPGSIGSSSNVESQIAALQSAISSQTYSASASPFLGGGSPNTIAAANAIDQLSGTTISSPTITGGTIANTALSGGPISATSLSVSGTTALTGTLSVGGNLTAGSISFSTASSTGITAIDATTTNLVATNATSTNLFATLGNFTSAIANTLSASVANIVGFSATNGTTTDATSTNLYSATASSTNLFAETASLGSLNAGTLALASTLNVGGLSTLAGFISTASSTIGDGTQTGGLTISGGATTTKNAVFQGPLTLTDSTGAFNGGDLQTAATANGADFMINVPGVTGSVGVLDYYTEFRFDGAQNKWYFGADASRSYLQTGLSHDMWFGPGDGGNAAISVPVLALTSGGNAGVGTSTPATTLSVAGSGYLTGGLGVGLLNTTAGTIKTKGGNDNELFLNNDGSQYTSEYLQNNGTTEGQMFLDNSNSFVGMGAAAAGIGVSLTYGAGIRGLNITSTGNVGIGTTSPAYNLAVVGTSKASQFVLSNTTGYALQVEGQSGTGIYRDATNNTLSLLVGTGGLTINSAGTASSNSFSSGGEYNSTINPESYLVGIGSQGIYYNGTGLLSFPNDSLGIGQISPASPLSVNGGISAGTYSATAAPSGGMIISGNVGIGTTSPETSLEVTNGGLTYDPGSAIIASRDNLLISSNTNYTGMVLTGSPGSSTPGLNGYGMAVFNPSNAAQFYRGSWMMTDYADGASVYLTIGTGNNPGFNTRILTAMPNGNVGIGAASPYSRLQVSGPDTASTSAFAVVNSASTTEFTVYDTGNATLAGSLVQNSDQRLKTNIQNLDASSSLAEINALNPVTFNWIDPAKSSVPQYGFIAQQVQSVFPDLVSTTSPTALTPDGTLGLNYTGLISPIVKAIQQLDQELTSLAETVAGFAQSFTTNVLTATTGTIDHFTTNELCVGGTCVTPAQFQAMLAAANQSGAGGTGGATPPPASDASSSSSSNATTTDATDTPPVIKINGDNPAVIQVGATYADLGATITSPQTDLNLGLKTLLNGALVSNIVLDTTAAATDTIDYVATDSQGLTSTSTRAIIVEPAALTATPPPPPSTDGTSTAATSSMAN